MKRFGKLLAVLLAAVVLLGGCAFKEDFRLKIKEDKNVDVSIVLSYDKEMLDGMIKMNDSSIKDGDITDDMRWEYLEKNVKTENDLDGAIVEKYENEGWYGYTYTKTLGTLDDLSTDDKNIEKASINDDDFDKKKLFFKDGDKYISNININKEESSYKSMDNYKSYGVGFTVTLTVELPDKAISNNATEVSEDGKTLTWNLLETQDVNFEFKMPEKNVIKTFNKGMITILAIVVVIIILIIAVVLIVVALTSNKNNSAPVVQDTKPVEEPVVTEEVKVEEPVKEEVVEEPAKEEVVEEKVVEKKAPAKKSATKKPATKKTETKKTTTKKAPAKKTATKKAEPKKTTTKKTATKKTTKK